MASAQVGLAAVAVGVEGDGVKVDPATRPGDELDTDGTPVGLHDESHCSEDFECRHLVEGIDGEVQVLMVARLEAGQRVDAPAPADPGTAPGARQGIKDAEDVGRIQFHLLEHRRMGAGAPDRLRSSL
jgi:hypothetical protein